MNSYQKALYTGLLFCVSLQLYAQTLAAKFVSSVPEITIINCSVANSDNLEFSPTYYHNGLVFATSRSEKGALDKKIDEHFFELYYAEIAPTGMPMQPYFFSPALTSRLHEGPVAFNRNFTKIYFTRNNIVDGVVKKDKDGDVNLQIFEAEKSPTDWVNLHSLPFNKADYSCAHPSLSADERLMYFSSNMPGGYGGMDLYMVDKSGETWGKPVNLGPKINTSNNEIFPFIHPDGVLFFTSDKQGGFGGLDIYKVNRAQSGAIEAVNIGVPYNSSSDDLGIIMNMDGTKGYLTSAREGGLGKDDIYYFETPEPLIQSGEVNLVVTVVDEETGKLIPMADLRVLKGTAGGFLENDELYDLELVPSASKSGELSLQMVRKSESQLPSPIASSDSKGIVRTSLIRHQNYILVVSKEDYATEDVFHSTMNGPETQYLTVKLKPQTCVMLTGTVVAGNYGRGVPGAVVKIYNQCSRTEEYVRTNLDGVFYYCLQDNCDFDLTTTKEDYHPGIAKATTKGTEKQLNVTISLLPFEESIVRAPLKKGSIIILDKIYYDFDMSYIRVGAARDLDALIQLMKRYPSMIVELSAHTDSRGTAEYNSELSLLRAKAAKDYVTVRGIDGSRITTFGYGEAFPRNGCSDGVDCSEEEHQFNRRTEIRVVEIDEPVTVNYKDVGPKVIDEKKN